MQKNANCYDMLELLEENPGRAILVKFSTPEDLENFRVKLYQAKKRNDEQLIGIGFINEEDKKSLSFKRSLDRKDATISIVERKEQILYFFTLIEPDGAD